MLPNESLVLDGLNLTTGVYRLAMPDGIVHTSAKKRQEWVQGADSDGAVLLRDPLSENCTWSLKVRIVGAASRDAANQAIGAIEDKLEEAERQSDGLSLVWTPAGGTLSLTWQVLSGEVEELPITVESGYFAGVAGSPLVSVRLDCKPFGYGAAVTEAALSGTTPVLAYVVENVTGDVPAEARLVLTDLATQSRRWVEGGLQSRYYDPATNLLLDTSQLTITGFGGTSTTRAGSFSTNVFRVNTASQAIAVCGTGNKLHIGTYRVIGRCYASVASGNPAEVQARFSYQDGSGVFRAGSYTSGPVANAWSRFDFGTITITQAQQGTQQWSGRVEAYSGVAGNTLDIDFLWLVPVDEGYFKVRGDYLYSLGAIGPHDEFTGITPGTVLGGRTAPVGGTWATSGATTDFAAVTVDGVSVEGRSTTTDTGFGRFAILGATSFTDTEVGLQTRTSGNPSFSAGVIARYVDNNNFMRLDYTGSPSGAGLFGAVKVVAGAASYLIPGGSVPISHSDGVWYGLRVVVFATGTWVVLWLDQSGNILKQYTGTDPVFATGGTLASGKPGILDQVSGSPGGSRYYRNFYEAAPVSPTIALYSGKQAEIRFDGYQRQDASSVWGPLVARGGKSYLYLPPAGGPDRSTRITVMSHRNDLSVAEWNPVTDSLQAQPTYTPRYVAVPRAGYLPRDLPTGYTAGRTFLLREGHPEDEANFTLSGIVSNSLVLSNPANLGTVFTNAADLRNVDIRMRYSESSTAGVANILVQLYARYVDASNHWVAFKHFDPGNPNIDISAVTAAAAQTVLLADDVANLTSFRWMRLQIIEDSIRVKSWIDGAAEPDWGRTRRIRPPTGVGTGASTTVQDTETGKVGVALQFTGGHLSELDIAELTRTDSSITFNQDMVRLGTDNISDIPSFWFSQFTVAAGNSLTRVVAADRFGVSRSMLQVVKTATNPAGGPMWGQELYQTANQGSPGVWGSRTKWDPNIVIPRNVIVSVWSKGTNVAFSLGGGATLGATFVAYSYDNANASLNAGDPNYFRTLGPNAQGLGTWDWYETTWLMPMPWYLSTFKMVPQVGFHDDQTTGTLLVSDVTITPV